MRNRVYYIYILTTANNTVLYIGVTNDLTRRLLEHLHHWNNGFTAKYNVEKLVYFELFLNIRDAIRREKQLKHWNRSWKEELINSKNPEWEDLFHTL